MVRARAQARTQPPSSVPGRLQRRPFGDHPLGTARSTCSSFTSARASARSSPAASIPRGDAPGRESPPCDGDAPRSHVQTRTDAPNQLPNRLPGDVHPAVKDFLVTGGGGSLLGVETTRDLDGDVDFIRTNRFDMNPYYKPIVFQMAIAAFREHGARRLRQAGFNGDATPPRISSCGFDFRRRLGKTRQDLHPSRLPSCRIPIDTIPSCFYTGSGWASRRTRSTCALCRRIAPWWRPRVAEHLVRRGSFASVPEPFGDFQFSRTRDETSGGGRVGARRRRGGSERHRRRGKTIRVRRHRALVRDGVFDGVSAALSRVDAAEGVRRSRVFSPVVRILPPVRIRRPPRRLDGDVQTRAPRAPTIRANPCRWGTWCWRRGSSRETRARSSS